MNAAEDITLNELADLSANPAYPVSDQSCQKLIRKLADLVVLPAAKLSRNERDFVADIMIRTLEQLSADLRQEVALRLAGFADIPVQLQRYLITEAPPVAVPMLERVSNIPESILLEAIEISYEHRKAVASRDDITASIVDALIRFNELDIALGVLRNDEIEISSSTMDILVARSELEGQLCEALLRRPELRLDHGLRMFWWLKPQARRQVLARCSTDRSIIQEALHSLFVEISESDTPNQHVNSILQLVDRRHRPRGRNGEAVSMEVVERTLRLAMQNPTDDFANAVGKLAGVSSETAKRVLHDYSGEAFAVLCKSTGLSRRAYNELLESQAEKETKGVVYSEDKRDELLGVFDSIARDYSRTILRYWDWKKEILTQSISLEKSASDTVQAGSSNYLGAV